MTRRLFWIGVGVAVTVVVYRKGRQVVRQYLPATLAERAETAAKDASERATTAVGEFRAIFTEARARREAELTAALLAEGQPDPEVTRATRSAAQRSAVHRATGVVADSAIDDDEDALGYSF